METPDHAGQSRTDGNFESAKRSADPRLGATLAAEYEAVCNDLAEAQELAAVYQRQLAVKSNDFAQLKLLLEKTQRDLQSLQQTINELRSERHRLANEAQRAIALEVELKYMVADKLQLTEELESSRYALQCAHRTLQGLWERIRNGQHPIPMIAGIGNKATASEPPGTTAGGYPAGTSVQQLRKELEAHPVLNPETKIEGAAAAASARDEEQAVIRLCFDLEGSGPEIDFVCS